MKSRPPRLEILHDHAEGLSELGHRSLARNPLARVRQARWQGGTRLEGSVD